MDDKPENIKEIPARIESMVDKLEQGLSEEELKAVRKDYSQREAFRRIAQNKERRLGHGY